MKNHGCVSIGETGIERISYSREKQHFSRQEAQKAAHFRDCRNAGEVVLKMSTHVRTHLLGCVHHLNAKNTISEYRNAGEVVSTCSLKRTSLLGYTRCLNEIHKADRQFWPVLVACKTRQLLCGITHSPTFTGRCCKSKFDEVQRQALKNKLRMPSCSGFESVEHC